jgi:hypothetical protein
MIVAAMLLPVSVYANDNFPWQGAQVQTSFGVSESGDILGMRASFTHFWVPSQDLSQFFSYVGPTFTLGDFWISPQVGIVGNWTEDGRDMFLESLWFSGDFTDDDGWGPTFFLEGDVYTDDFETFYYTYASLDMSFAGSFNLGLHNESVDDAFMFGPHFGLTKDQLHLEVQYYLGYQEDRSKGHTVRLSTSFDF